MKKLPLLHPEISLAIARLGRGDRLAITDAGFPVPEEAMRIDLALTHGIPGFTDTLRVVMTELDAEEAIVAEDLSETNPPVFDAMKAVLGNIPVLQMLNAAFNQQVKMAKVVIRTGETSAFANIILRAGSSDRGE
jgi:D-ribose pyranase